MAITAPTKPAARPALRPITLSANGRTLSYRSKSGKVLTVELKSSKNADDSTRREITLTKAGDKSTAAKKRGEVAATKSQGMWPDLYDTLSFWCAEAIEIAAFGPYDEPRQ